MKNLLSDHQLLSRLIGFDTVSRNSNLPIVDFVCDYVDRPGVDIERHPSPDGEKANLIITVGQPAPSDRSGLVLSGHLDVVPADEPEWKTDPFALTEVDGRYVGRGVCDMKGFVALAVNAAAAADPHRLKRPLVLVLTYDEELGIVGARHLAEGYTNGRNLPKNAVVGEPTSLRVVRMHKGYLEFRVSIAGKSAHSGYPHLGVNAIVPAAQLITALSAFQDELRTEAPPNREHFPEVPYVALNVGRIRGGTAANIVPDRCTLDCSIRLLPGMDGSQMVPRVREVIHGALGVTAYEFVLVREAPPLLLNEHAPVYSMLCSAVGQSSTYGASYATDAGWLQTMGLECAVFGPGSIETAHRPNESLPIAEFNRGSEIVHQAVHHFCIASQPQ